MSIAADSYGVGVATPVREERVGRRGRISWGAVFAGTFIAVTIGLMLHMLGLAVAGMLVDTTDRETASATTFGVGAALVMVIANVAGLAFGAYAAARLANAADETDAELHGLTVWAAAFLLSAALLGSLAAGIASTAATAAGSVLGGVAQGAGTAAASTVDAAAENPSATEALVNRATSALNTGGDPANMSSDQRKAEIASLIGRRVSEGQWTQAERDRMNLLVAAENGISPQDAAARVNQAEQETAAALQEAEETARQAADAAATATSLAALAMFLTMLLGIGAVIIGARVGHQAHIVYYRNRTATTVVT